MARPKKKSLLAEGFSELVELLRNIHSKLDDVIKAQKKSGRGPGRPVKSGKGPGRPKKSGRGPGRPKKTGRGPGRPKKSGRGPGRPPKQTTPVIRTGASKRGRPPGSKNKKK